MEKEGWSIDITSSNVTHYYKDGVSLCKRKLLQFYMDKFDKSIDYSQILGKNCTNCYIKLKKMHHHQPTRSISISRNI